MGEPVPTGGVPLYADARHYSEAGIPTVMYGCGPRTLLDANAHRARRAHSGRSPGQGDRGDRARPARPARVAGEPLKRRLTALSVHEASLPAGEFLPCGAQGARNKGVTRSTSARNSALRQARSNLQHRTIPWRLTSCPPSWASWLPSPASAGCSAAASDTVQEAPSWISPPLQPESWRSRPPQPPGARLFPRPCSRRRAASRASLQANAPARTRARASAPVWAGRACWSRPVPAGHP